VGLGATSLLLSSFPPVTVDALVLPESDAHLAKKSALVPPAEESRERIIIGAFAGRKMRPVVISYGIGTLQSRWPQCEEEMIVQDLPPPTVEI
jgi:hypothetical protein